MGVLNLFKHGCYNFLVAWHIVPSDCLFNIEHPSDVLTPSSDDHEEDIASLTDPIMPGCTRIVILDIKDPLENSIGFISLILWHKVVAVLIPVKELAHVLSLLFTEIGVQVDQVTDVQLTRWIIFNDLSLNLRDTPSQLHLLLGLVIYLLDEYFSEGWHSEVANGKGLALKVSLVILHTLPHHVVNTLAQDGVDEDLVLLGDLALFLVILEA